MVNQKNFRQGVAGKCGETNGAWLLGLNVVSVLVSMEISRTGKIAKKVEIVKV